MFFDGNHSRGEASADGESEEGFYYWAHGRGGFLLRVHSVDESLRVVVVDMDEEDGGYIHSVCHFFFGWGFFPAEKWRGKAGLGGLGQSGVSPLQMTGQLFIVNQTPENEESYAFACDGG